MSVTLLLLSIVLGIHKPLPSPDYPRLSPKGKSALVYLEGATSFETVGVGYAGKLSRGASALQTLYAEKDADNTFKYLLAHGGEVGQLYALCGLYFTDNAYFHNAIERYRTSRDSVEMVDGCMIMTESVRSIIESRQPGAVRLRDTAETIQQWAKRSGSETIFIDIFGGGYSYSFLKSRQQ